MRNDHSRAGLAGRYGNASMIAKCSEYQLRDARRKLASLVEIVRWIWVVNAAVMLVGSYYGRFDLAALAGFTWLMALVSAGIARRLIGRLGADPESVFPPQGAQEGET